ncbi:MAG: hypothetical protein E7168_02630 [Firmicutes bacterium]|nr:hypothetical protein [Bacillota bacterium]
MRSKTDQRIYNKTKCYLEKIGDKEIQEKLKIIDSILEYTDKSERYGYLYDLICDYLDQEFRGKNICGFSNNLCRRRCDMMERNITKDTYLNGCCHSYKTGKDCEHLTNQGCGIKNIACKTYTCFYLKKRGYRYNLDNIYLSRYFFNRRQKLYIETTHFVDKPIIMQGILEREYIFKKKLKEV